MYQLSTFGSPNFSSLFLNRSLYVFASHTQTHREYAIRNSKQTELLLFSSTQNWVLIFKHEFTTVIIIIPLSTNFLSRSTKILNPKSKYLLLPSEIPKPKNQTPILKSTNLLYLGKHILVNVNLRRSSYRLTKYYNENKEFLSFN